MQEKIKVLLYLFLVFLVVVAAWKIGQALKHQFEAWQQRQQQRMEEIEEEPVGRSNVLPIYSGEPTVPTRG